MLGLLLLGLAIGGVIGSQADVNISDYVYWKKEHISQYHQFFPLRALEEERQTNIAAAVAVKNLDSGLSEDLRKIVAFQYQELLTAQQLMADTPAEGCVGGIINFLDQAIEDQVNSYEDCTAYALSKLSRLNNTWERTRTSYLTTYQKTLSGVDACAKTYPNKDTIDRLRSCVEYMKNNYYTAADNTQSSVISSPSMTYFQNTVVNCLSSTAEAVSAKGSEFLKKLVDCAALSGTVDPKAYAEELGQWKGYKNTLSKQIVNSQSDNYNQVQTVETNMVNFYNLKKAVLEMYEIESRGLDFYLQKIYLYLSAYYNTVTATSLDNPGDSGCVAAAQTSLDITVNTGAAVSLTCDEQVVNDTKRRMAEIYDTFLSLDIQMPSIGNVAVLDCFSQGFVFAPQTIEKCFNLSYSEFELDYYDAKTTVFKDFSIISDYVQSIFSDSQLPCGESSLKPILLAAERVLYDLQRCLYKSSGTSYKITTPVYTTVAETTITTQGPSYNGTTIGYPTTTTTEAYTRTYLTEYTTTEYPTSTTGAYKTTTYTPDTTDWGTSKLPHTHKVIKRVSNRRIKGNTA